MKKIISIIIIALLYVWACTPDNPSMDFGSIPDDGRIKVFDVADDNSFMFVNGLQGAVLPPKWDLGNGQTAVGDTVYAGYAFTGTYTVTMTYYNGTKEVSVSKSIKITQDNMALVSDPVYNMLTGGIDALNGKTWVLDSLRTGHIRLWRRQTGQESDDKKAPLFYAGTGMYDDEIRFKLLGAECTYENHGQSYSHGGTIDGVAQYRIEQLRQMGSVTGVTASPKGDFIVNYTPGMQPQKWSLTKRELNGKMYYYLKLTGGAYMFFYRGNSPSDIEYRIDSIADNYLRVVHAETYPASRATAKWEDHYLLVPKGYPILPEVPTQPDPPKEETIKENFESASKSLAFTLSDMESNPWGLPSYSTVRNVSMTEPNPSDSIARVVRGSGYNERLTLSRNYTFNLSSKNKLKMQVYLPKTNNYDGVNLKPTVSVSLVDSKNSALTVVKTQTILSSNYGKWVDVVFDFSDSSAITSFNTWVIQFGGQYTKGTSASPGIFYFDNIELVN
ncbi:hypothetical protein [Dysgonomonas sp. BGC7]|uniref:hypothetical protein n=1 Tax=Dysgonomonas sp. BGC7 TaxID=1658008 RepID=UPI0006801644|nr:hypothetical protein [Dysgonomonas sp. BGC7]MBD8389348.1 hypothetical protein [Dysgonomonas sp. BGC7]